MNHQDNDIEPPRRQGRQERQCRMSQQVCCHEENTMPSYASSAPSAPSAVKEPAVKGAFQKCGVRLQEKWIPDS